MRSIFVVLHIPLADLLTNLVEVSELVYIEHFSFGAAIKALDRSILNRLAGFDAVDEDAVLGAPARKDFTQELRSAIEAQNVGQAPLLPDTFGQPRETR